MSVDITRVPMHQLSGSMHTNGNMLNGNYKKTPFTHLAIQSYVLLSRQIYTIKNRLVMHKLQKLSKTCTDRHT